MISVGHMPSDAEIETVIEDVQAQIKKKQLTRHICQIIRVAQTTYWSAEIRKIDGRILEVNDQSTPSTGQELKTEGTVHFLIKRLMSN